MSGLDSCTAALIGIAPLDEVGMLGRGCSASVPPIDRPVVIICEQCLCGSFVQRPLDRFHPVGRGAARHAGDQRRGP